MIADLLTLLRDVVNAHLRASTGASEEAGEHGLVVFPGSDKTEYLDCKLGAVTLLLINLEQEHSNRPADPHRVVRSDGSVMRVAPPLYLNLHVLFVARLRDYQQSLLYLSQIVRLFQTQRVLSHDKTPALQAQVESLTVELQTPSLADLNQLWSMLRCAYQPSLLYRLRMVAYTDEDALAAIGPGPELNLNTRSLR